MSLIFLSFMWACVRVCLCEHMYTCVCVCSSICRRRGGQQGPPVTCCLLFHIHRTRLSLSLFPRLCLSVSLSLCLSLSFSLSLSLSFSLSLSLWHDLLLKFGIGKEDTVKVIRNLGRTPELDNLLRSYWAHLLGVSDGLLQVLGHIVRVKTQEVQDYQLQGSGHHVGPTEY